MSKEKIYKIAGVVGASAMLVYSFTASADVLNNLLPTADGNYTQWTPSTGTSHFALVDETTCNGNTDYNSTNTVGNRDSYTVDVSSIPNGATITQIDIKPCAARNVAGGANPKMDVFYRFGSTNSSDAGAYTLSATVPTELATTTFSSVNKYKTSTTTVEAGAVLSSGTKGARLSRILTYVTYTLLPTPTGLNSVLATTTPGKINLTWSISGSGYAGTVLERSNDNVNWSGLATTSLSSYSDTGLSSGTYYYRTRTYNFGGYSSYSGTASTTVPTVPADPSGLTATGASDSVVINLAWADNATNEDNYLIERSLDGVSGWSNVATTSANAVSYGNTGLVSSTTYYYRVRAKNSQGYSGYTSVASATTGSLPSAPSGLSTSLSGTDITLSWTDNSSNEDVFSVERKINSGFYTVITSVATNTISYLDLGVASTSGTTIAYRVRARNGVGFSAYSDTATTTVP